MGAIKQNRGLLCETGITNVKNGSRSCDDDIFPFDTCFDPQLPQPLEMEGEIFIVGLCLCTDPQGFIDELETLYTSHPQRLLQDGGFLLSQPQKDQVRTCLDQSHNIFVANQVYLVERVDYLLPAITAKEAITETVQIRSQESTAEGHTFIDAFHFLANQEHLSLADPHQLLSLLLAKEELQFESEALEDYLRSRWVQLPARDCWLVDDDLFAGG